MLQAEGDAVAHSAMLSGSIDGCVVYLACCLGADPKLLDPAKDVMRIKDLAEGKIPATISSDAVGPRRARLQTKGRSPVPRHYVMCNNRRPYCFVTGVHLRVR